jgi:hypothetical protein
MKFQYLKKGTLIMTSKLQKIAAITCLVLLVAASISVAEDAPANRRGGQGFRGGRGSSQGGNGQGNGYRGGRGGMMGGGRGGMGGGMMGGGMGGRGMGMMGGRGMGQELIPRMIRQKLNLTEEQNTQLEVIQKKQMTQNQELSKQHDDLRKKLDDAVNNGEKDAIGKIAQDIGKNIGDTAMLKLSGKDSLKTILKEDQLKMLDKFNKQQQQRREKMREQMQRRMDGNGEGPGRGREGERRERPERPERRERPSRTRQ